MGRTNAHSLQYGDQPIGLSATSTSPRYVRIGALVCVHRHALDREDFLLLLDELGLDDLLAERVVNSKPGQGS